jgi:hypothetical protein
MLFAARPPVELAGLRGSCRSSRVLGLNVLLP